MYRAVTMWVTALPKADKNYECAEKFDGPLTMAELFKRVVKIVTGQCYFRASFIRHCFTNVLVLNCVLSQQGSA